MEQQFQNPPSEFRTLQIIHNFDSFGRDEPALRERLGALKALGIGGLVANVSFHNYMRSEEQWQVFLSGVKVAKELGFTLWLYDEEGYPSGSAGGLVLERYPEGEAIGLVRKVGEKGKIRYEVQRMYEGTHCTENVYKKRRYPNLLNSKAVQTFLQVTHQAYAQRLPRIGQLFHAVFTDEPSLVTPYIRPPEGAWPAIPWVEDLPQEFRRRKGYDLEPHLESLFTDTGDYRGVRCDFYEVVGQLLAERYFKPIQRWCRRYGLLSSGHLLAEESLTWHVMYYGDPFPCWKSMDAPGIDMLTSDPRAIVMGSGFLVPKLVSSAAHLAGRSETMSETSDYIQRGSNTRANLTMMKATANILYLLGINTITSYYAHPYGREEERKDYAQYNSYVGRLSVMLRKARHHCRVAVLYPIAGIWANFYPTALSMYQPHPNQRVREIDVQFLTLCQGLLQHQIDFDIVDEASLQRARLQKGAFRIGKESYRILVLPPTDTLHQATLQRIAQMIQKGIEVICVGQVPLFAASRNERDEEVKALAERWLGGDRLVPQINEKLFRRIQEAGGTEVEIAPRDPDLWIGAYEKEGRRIYFVVNVSQREIQTRLTLPWRGEFSLWDPNTGEIKRVETASTEGGISFPLSLSAFQGVFLVQGRGAGAVR